MYSKDQIGETVFSQFDNFPVVDAGRLFLVKKILMKTEVIYNEVTIQASKISEEIEKTVGGTINGQTKNGVGRPDRSEHR